MLDLGSLYSLLLAILALAVVCGGICIVASAIATRRGRPSRRLKTTAMIAGAVLACCVSGLIGIQTYMAWRARASVLARLNQMAGPYSVRVNGVTATDPDAVVAALKQLRAVAAHHSHTTARLRVDVEANGEALTVILARDSNIADEYWVYLPEGDRLGNPPADEEIGRITTTVFAGS